MEAIRPDRKTDKSEMKMMSLKNEKGIALVMVLVISAVCLAIMAALIYMVTARTQFSGVQKRYYTALEAGKGCADIMFEVIGAGQAGSDDAAVNKSINTHIAETALTSLGVVISTPGSCTGTPIFPGNGASSYHGIAAKLKTGTKKVDGTPNWNSSCDTSVTITPGTSSTYDLQVDFVGSNPLFGAGNPTYRCYAKIMDTVEGSLVSADTGLRTGGTTSQGGGGYGIHFLYTVEIYSANLSNTLERARLQALFQY